MILVPILKFLDKIISRRFEFLAVLIMDINDKSVLEMLNKIIVIDRLNKSQILHMVNLVSLSNDINDLKDNLKWERFR